MTVDPAAGLGSVGVMTNGGVFIWHKDGKFTDARVSFRDFDKKVNTMMFKCEVNANEVPLVIDPEDPPTHVELKTGGPYLLDETQLPVTVGDDGYGGAIVHLQVADPCRALKWTPKFVPAAKVVVDDACS